ncbi:MULTISPECIES: alpha/beta fold hydrolase [Pseudomonadati]|uniref:Alpha/beta fold hydrolase n=1 Tax=Shewanella aestuarii TaxID=1028752 RepID=A0ABT0L488_9GAMM|nr:alpha/beta fold hydrolase [Shewanella aestuarii]MCL1118515.1 alpha/beta fold hydrolase [Shewanella aestuarii]GGN82885.1 alpha/beta hydrolase [Shewanella aestuarii]
MIYKKFSSEKKLNTPEQQRFWQNVHQSEFESSDGVKIAFCQVLQAEAKQAVVISNGRVESYLKYQELIFDLYQQGYSVFALDHRGQGLSDRITDNPHQGYVGKFADYVDDFSYFIENIVLPTKHLSLSILAHSMGGAIATHYLDKHPNIFDSAVLSAPMFGIALPVNKKIILWLANRLNKTRESKQQGKVISNYVLGGTDYQPDPFISNHLTHSKHRYEHYRELYKKHPEIQLGSPTNHWLIEAVHAAEQSIEYAKQSQTPILILQASEDSVVTNQTQDLALSNLCHKVVIEGAFHEVFIEGDNLRNAALTYAINFIKLHSKSA